MDNLSDQLLLQAYLKAIEMDLQSDFIHLIRHELRKRNVLCLN